MGRRKVCPRESRYVGPRRLTQPQHKAKGGTRRDNRPVPEGGGGEYRTNYSSVDKTNAKLETYYNTLLDLPDDERKEFWDALKRVLPNSFRFAGSKSNALAVKRLFLSRYLPELENITHGDGEVAEPPRPVPWYPDSLAWSMTTPRQVVRKFPPFANFQRFLVSETTVGNISRQEVVSMIPPLLMDVRPGHVVLDMCAAPGSKSAQILEMLHVGEEARMRKFNELAAAGDEAAAQKQLEADEEFALDPSDGGRATGMLIANDADNKRAHLLVHQLKRLSSPNLLVTTHDATMFPQIRLPPDPENPGTPRFLKFDRILADVPCTGDGTMRKNLNLWKDWAPGNALGLHLVQVRILVRALQMLKVGGRVVYSTCSMNPVENEAVVGAAIHRCGGADKVDIVDCADQLPLLKRRPGLRSWKVMDKSQRMWSSWDEVEEHAKSTESGAIPGRLAETMFPLPEGVAGHGLSLERCMRIYAHLQDTGGFFIAVLEKKAEFKTTPEGPIRAAQSTAATSNGGADTTAPGDGSATKMEVDPGESGPQDGGKRPAEDEVDGQDAKRLRPDNDVAADPAQASTHAAPDYRPRARQQQQKAAFEEPFEYLAPDHPTITHIADFYQLSPRFPRDRFMVRNAAGEPVKGIYYTSSLIRDVLVCNAGGRSALRPIHGGLRVFVRQDAPSAEVCGWRIQSEALPILEGHVGDARVVVLRERESLRLLLREMFPMVSGDAWTAFPDVGERLRDVGLGCCVLRVEPKGDDPTFSERLVMPIWKSFTSVNLMLPKEDRSAMLLRIFNDTTPLVNTSKRMEKLKEEQKEQEAAGEDGEDAAVPVDIEDLPSSPE